MRIPVAIPTALLPNKLVVSVVARAEAEIFTMLLPINIVLISLSLLEISLRTLAARFEEHRREIHERIMKEHPELAQRFKERRHRLDEHLKERRPEVYDLVVSLRELEKRKDME